MPVLSLPAQPRPTGRASQGERIRRWQWTTATARAAGKLSAQRRAERKANGGERPLTPRERPTTEAAISRQLRLVASQIERTRKVLDDDRVHYCPACERSGIEPHHRAQLLKALDSLLDRQRELLGIPRVGSLRPRSVKDGRSQAGSVRPMWGTVAQAPAVPGPAVPASITTGQPAAQAPASPTTGQPDPGSGI